MLEPKKILVAGDFMLDVYTLGDVMRISPEAPVPVLHVVEESQRPGGAGNTILNLVSLGMEVVALGRVGQDEGGEILLDLLMQKQVDTAFIERDLSFQTPLKKRMIAAGQQLLRIDYETLAPLKSDSEERICASLPTLLKGIDMVAISDYAKGFLSPNLLCALITQARQLKIPVIVDPKGRDFRRYRGATLLKPNLAEAISAAGLGGEATLDEVARQILDDVSLETLLITRSRDGISTFTGQERRDYPAQVHEIKDVTGAGDTVLAVITAALANKMELSEAVELANIAAGIAIERVGCAYISLDDLLSKNQNT